MPEQYSHEMIPRVTATPRRRWRNWLLSATARAGVATGFLLTPTVREQLGDASMAALSVFISGLLILAIIGHWYLVRGHARRDLAADAFAVVALVPVGIVASGIQGAEDRFGGRTANVLAALAATILIFTIVALIARLDERLSFGDAAIGSLGGALTLAVLVGNPARFPTVDAWQAISLAWMTAAVATVVYAVLPVAIRNWWPLLVYAIFALVVIMLPTDVGDQTGRAASLPAIALVITGAVMVLVAPVGARKEPMAQEAQQHSH